ncbi:MAG: endonuclease III [Lentisphaerae bacterium]|nr:endonuclease III [Lentisphaerota bacterium]
MHPRTIARVHGLLRREFERRRAPIIDLIAAQTRDPFKVLVSTILSSRTQDATTAAASRRLYAVVKGPADLKRLTGKRLARLIYPVGFYRTKAKHLKQLPDVLDREFGGRVPDGIDDLCRLPGVGRKTANLVRAVGFGKPAVCVDVHVHRISNRLGLVKTKTPFETEMALRRALPRRYWITWNSLLVSHGQSTCLPRRPRCDACPVFSRCARVGVRQ